MKVALALAAALTASVALADSRAYEIRKDPKNVAEFHAEDTYDTFDGKTNNLIGMIVADPDATLLTVCEKGYGKRTPIGPNSPAVDVPEDDAADESTTPEPEAVGGEEVRVTSRESGGRRRRCPRGMLPDRVDAMQQHDAPG